MAAPSPVGPITPASLATAATATALRVQIMAGLEAGLMEAIAPITPAKDATGAAQAPRQAASTDAAAETEATHTAAPTAPASTAQSAPDPVRQAVNVARTAAAARQAPAAPLFADLAEAVRLPGLPAPVREAAAQALAARLPTATPVTAQSLRQAVAASGLFLEARMAAEPPAPEARQSSAQPDLKAALLTLRQVLTTLAAKPPTGASALPLPGTPGAETPQAARSNAASPETERPQGAPDLPPPTRQAALRGQPPSPATLTAQTPPEEAVRVLKGEVEQALARQTLHQIASAPEQTPTSARDPSQTGAAAAWMFELPIALKDGTPLAQFEVERDARGGSASGQVWRARFSLDVEALGPVHAHLALMGGRTVATVWAERPESLALLQAQAGDLARDLSGEVRFESGAPVRPAPAAGQFVDRLS